MATPTAEINRMLSAAVAAAEDRKAEDIVLLKLDPSESGLTDYFLICSATNTRQTVAIADEIDRQVKLQFGVDPNSIEGRREGEWVLMDYVDFIVHIFMPEKREYYGLERLRKSAITMSADDLNAELKAETKSVTAPRKAAGKAAAKKSAAKKSATRKSAASKGAKAVKKTAAKKAPAKKTAGRKAAAKKTAR